jgi:hypothetical protein
MHILISRSYKASPGKVLELGGGAFLPLLFRKVFTEGAYFGPSLIGARKAVNRGDKRSRRFRDRDFTKFERSRRYQDRYRCQEKKSRRGRDCDLVFRDPPPRRERELDR